MLLSTLEWQLGLVLGALLLFLAGIALGRSNNRRRLQQLDRELAMEQRLSLQIDDAPLPMLRVNVEGTMTAVNAQLVALFGYNSDELIGQPLELLIPPRLRATHAAHLRQYFARPLARPMALGRDLVGAHKDGHEIEIEVGLNAVASGDEISAVASIVDISEKKRWELELARANALMSAIIRSAPFSIIATDIHGTIIAVSAASERMLGYSQEGLVGRATPTIIHDRDEILARAQQLSEELGVPIAPGFDVFVEKARRGIVEEHEWTYIRKDGTRLPVSLTVTVLRDSHGAVTGYLGIAYDISERKRNEEYMRHLAHHDTLTGLPNRALLYDRLAMALERAERYGECLAVMLIDLDRFKQVNDKLGHLAGDHLLKTVAERLKGCVRSVDTVARIGGDEFVVVLPDCRGIDNVARIADKIVAEVCQPIAFEAHSMLTSPSIGVSVYPQDGADGETLLKHADEAMYAAKSTGRGKVKRFSSGVRAV